MIPNHSDIYNAYRKLVDSELENVIKPGGPRSLYDPVKYILDSGGKRIRPVLLMFACESAGGSADAALNAAVAIEMLHNFTLVHDDIMDNADSRRGIKTIHKKWNENVAILAGDQLIGLAYSQLLKTDSIRIKEIVEVFTEGIIEVCEGQSFDKEFEKSADVSIPEYLMMIRKKTSKLLEASALIGAIIGGASKESLISFRDYALNIGLAFQIRDDLLDIAADEIEFGKKIGGDIIEGKRTFLILKAVEVVNHIPDRKKILSVIEGKIADSATINSIREIYEKYGIMNLARKEIEKYTKAADDCLNSLPQQYYRDRLKWFSEMLMGRSF